MSAADLNAALQECSVLFIIQAPTALQRCHNDARIDGVDPDAILSKIHRSTARQLVHGRLQSAQSMLAEVLDCFTPAMYRVTQRQLQRR